MTLSPDGPLPPPQPRRLPLPLSRPRVTYALLAINVLVWLAMTLAGGSTNPDTLIRFGAKVNVLIADGQAWRLLTSMFLHIGLMHLFFNSYALFAFGMEVERLYGSGRFLAIYLLAGLWGALVSFALGPNLSAGASGAIFGLLGTMVAFFRRHRETFGAWGRQRLLNLLGVAGFNLVLGFTVPGIDNLAHLGGLLSGAALGWLLAPQYQPQVDEQGGLYIADRVSLRSRWWVVVLAVALLVVGTAGAMAVQRQSAAALILRGQRALDGEDSVAAESLFRQAVARDPRSAEAYFYLGVALSAQDRVAEAARAYQSVLRLQPDLAEAHWNLALAYTALRRPADAIAEFQAFIPLSPNSLDGEDSVAAESLFRQAVARDPRSAEAYFYLGVALSAQDRVAEAAQAYQSVLRLQPDLAEAHWNLALAYTALRRPADAIAEFQAFIPLSPNSPDGDRARAFIAELQKSVP